MINYKFLKQHVVPIQHPIPSKDDILRRLKKATIFSKFDLKLDFWQIQVKFEDRPKLTFVIPRGQYQWTILPFGLKIVLSIFLKMMDNIFSKYSSFICVQIDDILVYSKDIKQHIKHLKQFYHLCYDNGLALSEKKSIFC